MGEERMFKSSVLVPLIKKDNRIEVLFEKRAKALRRQSGEICFPGGRWEETDGSEWATAVREASEELQIPKESVSYAGDLDVIVTHSQQLIYPFVGFISNPEQIRPNPFEVEEVFTVELNRLLAANPQCHEVSMRVVPGKDFPYHLIPHGRQYPWRGMKVEQYFYEFDGYVIWGLTGRILKHFLDTIQ